MRSWIPKLFLITWCVISANAQDQNNPSGQSYVVVPADSVTVVVASQPNSPVEIAASKLLNLADGSRRAAFQYELVNRGTKPVKYVSVYTINSTGTGGGPLDNGHTFDKLLMPGQKIALGPPAAAILEPSSALLAKLGLNGSLRAIVVLIIESVEYSDGLAFSDMKTVKALLNYFVDINSEEINSRANGVRLSVPSKSTIPK